MRNECEINWIDERINIRKTPFVFGFVHTFKCKQLIHRWKWSKLISMKNRWWLIKENNHFHSKKINLHTLKSLNHEDVFVFVKSFSHIWRNIHSFRVWSDEFNIQASFILVMTTIHQLILKVCVTRFLCNALYINCFRCRRWHSFVLLHAHLHTLKRFQRKRQYKNIFNSKWQKFKPGQWA